MTKGAHFASPSFRDLITHCTHCPRNAEAQAAFDSLTVST